MTPQYIANDTAKVYISKLPTLNGVLEKDGDELDRSYEK
jgi:hypothetical protein